ncbi:hypothetical protein KP509_02G061500 [Ceratopteris richardii]|nr:hypothetical protein KP509_02G061500 [Ceratopteris richardii]
MLPPHYNHVDEACPARFQNARISRHRLFLWCSSGWIAASHKGLLQSDDVDYGPSLIPSEKELRKLHDLLHPAEKLTPNDDTVRVFPLQSSDDETDGVLIDSATLLSQAARYIVGLQVQVETLGSLAA